MNRFAASLVLLALLMGSPAAVQAATTFTVNSSNDVGDGACDATHCSLREAINASNAKPGSATVTIAESGPAPEVSIGDQAGAEGAGTAALTITLDKPTSTDVMVDFATSDGTAMAPGDYTAPTVASSTATIAAGATSTTIVIPLVVDALYEGDETFTVTLSNVTGDATLSPTGQTATFTIVDDDPLPELSIADVSVGEAAGNAVLTITLDPVSGLDVTVDFATADGSAVAPDDYTSASASTTVLAGSTFATVSIPISDDPLEEGDETFSVTLSNPINATTSTTAGSATVTIKDDEGPQFSIADVTVDEGAGSVTLTITLDPASDGIVSVDYATADGTATEPDDYIASSGTEFFLSGETAKTVVIQILDDALEEPTETFTVTLSDAFAASIGADGEIATVTILDELAPKVPAISWPAFIAMAVLLLALVRWRQARPLVR